MPVLRFQGATQTALYYRIYDLQNAPELYDGFRYRIKATSGGIWSAWWYPSGNTPTYAGCSGLICNTIYSIEAEACWQGTWWSAGTLDAITNSCSLPAPAVPTLYWTITSTSVNVRIEFGSNTSYAVVRMVTPFLEHTYYSSNDVYLFSGLSPNNSYTLMLYAVGSNGASTPIYYVFTTPAPTPPPGTPSVSLSSVTTTTITVNVYLGSDTTYVIVGGWKQLYSNGSWTFTGCSPNTNYRIDIVAYGPGGSTSGTSLHTTTSPGWGWSFVPTSGNACAVSASEWLSFCSYINSTRVNHSLAAYSFSTSYVASGQPFLATLANEARNAINAMGPAIAVPATVSSQDSINASWFSTIQNSLNSIA